LRLVWHEPLHKCNQKWCKVEDDTDIEASKHLVKDSEELVAAISIFPFIFSSRFFKFRSMFNDFSHPLISHERFKIQIAYLHDDLQSHKVNDAVFYRFLICQQVEVNSF